MGAEALEVLGRDTQVIMGVLVLVGVGLLWRLRTAWTFAVLTSMVTNGEDRVLAVAGSARTLHLLKLARADMVFASAAVGSRILANLVEGNEIPREFRDLLEGDPGKF